MNNLNNPNIVVVLTFLLFMFRFVDVIYRELWEGCVAEIKAAHFLSVLSDSSTDVIGRDLEGFFVRILSCGHPKNIFIGVEELKHATAPGHFAAMSDGKPGY